MSLSKEKKVVMFLKVDGKCEYCGRDMVLSFNAEPKKRKDGGVPDNLATFDHVYSKDHELRNEPHKDDERRIFIVCNDCNHKKSQLEPNKQEPRTSEKTVKRLVPKEKWNNERLMAKITEVVIQENELNKQMNGCNAEIMKLNEKKRQLTKQVSDKVKYRNLLLSYQNESNDI